MAPACTEGRRHTGRGSAMLWAMSFWETLGPAIHVEVTLTHTTNLHIVADQEHPVMEMVFSNGSGLFQQDNAPCQTAKIIRKRFEEHNRFMVLTSPPNSPVPIAIEHLWDVLDKQA